MSILKWSPISVLLVFSVVCGSTAQASNNHYVWNDLVGVKSMSSCTITSANHSLPKVFSKYLDQVVEIIDIPTLAGGLSGSAELRGSYLQISTKDGIPQTMKCDGSSQTYIIFDITSIDEKNSFWRIGVTASHLEIFHHSQVLASEQVEEIYNLEESAPMMEMAATASSTEQVYCLQSPRNNVYATDLSSVLFKINAHEVVQPIQSFDGTHTQNKIINGKFVAFIKILVPRLKAGQNIGWVAKHLVEAQNTCTTYKPKTSSPIKASATTSPSISDWTFPTIKRATTNYKTGMRAFKASRGGGKRWHAACDIYRLKDETALSITSGTVVRGLYFFYQGTYALEIRHSDGKIARYGEITSRVAPGVKTGATTQAGQVLGYIGKVNSDCCQPMLHFELYSGKAIGALTQSINKFSRRSDLIDPSSYLTDWEKTKFAVSY